MFLINKHIFYVLSLYSNSVILKTPGHLLKRAELFLKPTFNSSA